MTTGDGIFALALAGMTTGVAWAVAWTMVRLATIRAEILRRLGEPTWQQTKTTKRGRA